MNTSRGKLGEGHQPLKSWRRVASTAWQVWCAPVVLALWILAVAFFLLRRYDTFQTATFDQGFYTQVIWNTAHGHWFASTLRSPTALADHFSPALALLAPIFWVFPDARALELVKVLCLGLAVLPAYLLLRKHYPWLAPLLILFFVLNPTINQTALDTSDFHGIDLAALTLALALYALQRERLGLLWEALLLTLLVREDMGLFVFPFGLFLLFFRPKWRRSGVAIMLVAAAWTVLVVKVLVPAAGHSYVYLPQLVSSNKVWDQLLHGSLPAITDVISLFITPEKMGTVWAILWPMALLPLLTSGAQVLWIPYTLLLLAAPSDSVGLQEYHLMPLIPLWWWALSMALVSVPPRWAKAGVAVLVGTTLVGAYVQGPISPVKPFDWARYNLTAHDRLGPSFLATIPPTVPVAVQSGLGPHLATRPQVAMFPWFDINLRPQYIVLDTKGRDIYPYTPDLFKKDIRRLKSDPTLRIAREQDGYLAFAMDSDPQLPHQGPWQWLPYLELGGYGLAQTDAAKVYQPAPFTPSGGRMLRVELYWTALAPMTDDYKISVLVKAADGFILAQDDARPALNSLQTQDWAPGRTLRDIHYLQLPANELLTPLSLAVVIYESNTLKRLPPETDVTLTTLP
jgi:uncharacterized membrane protein